MNFSRAAVFTLAALAATASADVVVTLAGSAPEGANVRVSSPKGFEATLSARNRPSRAEKEKDRDLGQTFTTGDEEFYLEKITLHTSAEKDKEVLPGVFGANVSVQIIEVGGKTTVNTNGTDSGRVTYWTEDPRADDFIEGEAYTQVALARGGRMPAYVRQGQFIVLNFRGADRVKLKPNTHYGFIFMFDTPAADRAMPLTAIYWDESKLNGHVLKREGDAVTGALSADFKKRNELSGNWKAASDAFADLAFWVEGSASQPAVAVHRPEAPLPLPSR